MSVPWIFARETAVIQDDPSTLCLYRNENSHQPSTVPTISKTHGRMEASKLPSAKDGEQLQIEKQIIIRVLGKRERESEKEILGLRMIKYSFCSMVNHGRLVNPQYSEFS